VSNPRRIGTPDDSAMDARIERLAERVHDSIDPSVRDDVVADRLESWRARTAKDCKGCGVSFMRRARADVFCDDCKRARTQAIPETVPGSPRVAVLPRPVPPRSLKTLVIARLWGEARLTFVADFVNVTGASHVQVVAVLDGLERAGVVRWIGTAQIVALGSGVEMRRAA
jgi:hypothetical protein